MTLAARQNDKVYNGTEFSHATTATDKPMPPTITSVKQIDKKVRLTWVAPARPNGIVEKYIVLMRPPDREWDIPGNKIIFYRV